LAKEDKKGGACDKSGEEKNSLQGSGQKYEEIEHLQKVGIKGRIILILILTT